MVFKIRVGRSGFLFETYKYAPSSKITQTCLFLSYYSLLIIWHAVQCFWFQTSIVLSSQHNRSSVTAMIQRLGWRSLEDRRRDARLTTLYKIDHELVAISKTDRLDRPTRRLWQSHDNAYQVPHCRIDVRKMSFFPRTVRDWNALPPDKASMDTLEAFKASICVQ